MAKRGQPELHYAITDVAGNVKELCSPEGQVHWRSEQGLWQELYQWRLEHFPKQYLEEAILDPLHCDLRHQGQIVDEETGLYYNRHRYYDPQICQYLSPDPIGLAGGTRPQAYVHNPLEWVDPLGLAGCPIRDQKVQHIAEKYGGVKLDDGGYKMPSKRAAKQAASEIAGDLGSKQGRVKVRREEYEHPLNNSIQKKSKRVIGKTSEDGKSGYRDHNMGHKDDSRPHINVWSEKTGTTSSKNFHLYY